MTSPSPISADASAYSAPASIRGRICWHECLTTDADGARAFYQAVFGWGDEAFPMGDFTYHMWTVNGVPSGGFQPIPDDAKAQGAPQHWLTYFGTPDVDASAGAVTAAGGTVMVPPQDIPGVGRFAVVTDPFGALFALYKPNDAAPETPGMPPLGDASWHELATTDGAAAREFYVALLGWDAMGDVDMGDGMTYRMVGRHGAPLGGIFDITEQMPGMRPNWVPYFRVADVQATIERVTANGGTLLNGPMEVPGGDVIAQFLDAQGGYFCAHEARTA